MYRKPQCAIAWVLIAAMTVSPSMVYAQPPTVEAPRAEKPKLDMGYITPGSVAAVSLYPQSVLTSPELELLPTEVLSALGMKELGIDPLHIEHALAIAEPPTAGPPQVGIVLRFSQPLAQGKILGRLWEQTAPADLDGKSYRQGKGPMGLSIFQPDPRTLVVATDELLRKMVANHAAPQGGKMTKMLAHVPGKPDLLAVVLIEPLRSLLSPMVKFAPVPPPFAGVKEVPELVNYVAVKADLTGDMDMMFTVRADDETAAKRLEGIIDDLMAQGKKIMEAEIAKQEASNDPVEQAMAKYARRTSARMMETFRPVRKGATLSLSGSGRANAQVATIGILIGLLLPAVQAAREAGRRAQSINNLKQIGLAMANYVSVKGSFPARANFNAQGKPLLSWRVHILPFLEQESLYQQFHLDEPWDSDHNKKLIPLMPSIYSNPSLPPRAGMSDYLGVNGRGLIFEGDKARKPADITDGLSHTIAVVEADENRAVTWTKPDDWEFDATSPLAGLGNAHPSGFCALFCDGSVQFISKDIDPTVFKALLTIAGGEAVGSF